MELFKLLGTIAVDNSSAINSLEDTTDQAKKAEGKMSDTFKKIGQVVVTAFAVDKIKDFGISCMEVAAEIQASNSQFAQTFEDFADAANDAIDRVATTSGIIPSRLKNAATSIYAFAKTTGMESSEALGMMERSLQAAADSAAYYDRSLDDVTETLKSFLKGNYENDSALGLSCTEITRNTAANKLYGKSFQELSESQKQLTLLQMVEEANQLSGAMGQAARESDGWENVLGNIKETIKQLKGKIGQPILKNVIPAIKKLTDAVDKNADRFTDALVPILDTLIGTILPAFVDIVVFAAEHFEELTVAIALTVAAFKTMKVISSVTTALEGATGAMATFNAVMSANVIGAVVSVVGTLAVGIGALVMSQKEEVDQLAETKEAINEEREAREKKLQAIQDEKDAIDKKAESELVEIANVESLWKELQTLCDETGKVQEADKARAEFIITELNEALGTEYDLNTLNKETMAEMREEVYKLIEAKRADILLAAQEEKYKLAINNIQSMENDLTQASIDLAEQKEKENQAELDYLETKKEAEEKLLELEEKAQKFAESGSRDAQAANKIRDEIFAQQELIAEKESAWQQEKLWLKEKEDAYASLQAEVSKYYTDMANYENASALILEGKTTEAVDLLDSMGRAYKTAAELAKESSAEQLKVLREQREQAEVTVKEIEKLLENADEKNKAIYERQLENAKKHLEDCKNEYKKAGGEVSEAFGKGIEEKTPEMTKKIQSIFKDISSDITPSNFLSMGFRLAEGIAQGIDQGKDKPKRAITQLLESTLGTALEYAQIHSPSRLFAKEVGAYIPSGVGMGIEDNEDAAVDPMRDMIGRMASVGNGDVVNNYAHNSSTVNQYGNATTDSKLEQLIESIKNLKIYLNGDTLVGELAPAMDMALGDIATGNERGH